MKKFIIILLLGGVLCSCGQRKSGDEFVRSVILVSPTPVGQFQTKNYAGTIKEAEEVSLGFKTPGQVKSIFVREGDYVRKGQLLATLDDVDYALGVEALQIQYEQLKGETERLEQMYKSKGISANDYEKAVAGLGQLAVQLKVNKNKLDYTKLYAPADSYVQSVSFSPAEMVDAGTPVFTLLDVSHLEVETNISVSDYLQKGGFESFTCVVPGSGSEIALKLLSITPKADGTQLYQMKLLFAERPSQNITSGMNVAIKIKVSDDLKGQTLPMSAVGHEGDQAFVYVYDESSSTIERRDVSVSDRAQAGKILVTAGLDGSEKVVRSGLGMLLPAEKVKPLQRASKTNVGDLL